MTNPPAEESRALVAAITDMLPEDVEHEQHAGSEGPARDVWAWVTAAGYWRVEFSPLPLIPLPLPLTLEGPDVYAALPGTQAGVEVLRKLLVQLGAIDEGTPI